MQVTYSALASALAFTAIPTCGGVRAARINFFSGAGGILEELG